MIVFKKVRFKNFLSVGAQFQEIVLNDAKFTIIIGPNGAGKTTSVTAIYFALYGRSFSKANIGSLVNNFNKKDCVVELEFEVSGTEYKIVRGITPNFLQIYQNGKLVPELPNVREYQNWLISNVIKIPEITFRQIILLGSTQYIPFMRLSASQRRSVIETILGLDMFPYLKNEAKNRLGNIKKEIENLTIEIDKLNIANGYCDKRLDEISKSNEFIQESNKRLSDLKSKLKYHIEQAEMRKKKIQTLQEKFNQDSLDMINRKIEEERKAISASEGDIRHFKSMKEIYTKSQCPYCLQDISISFSNVQKEKIISDIQKRERHIKTMNEKIMSDCKELDYYRDLLLEIQSQEQEYKQDIHNLESVKDMIENEKKRKASLAEISKKQSDTILTEKKMTEKSISETDDKRDKEKRNLMNYERILNMFDDTGIKTVIIKNYLGSINMLMRKYIEMCGLNISFSFDEHFDETIKMRSREVVDYSAFSAGERAKIDIAILFMLRDLASLRNSVSCNLLIADEMLDGVVDISGIDAISNIFRQTDKQVIFITHNPEAWENIADRTIKVTRPTDFSKYEIF